MAYTLLQMVGSGALLDNVFYNPDVNLTSGFYFCLFFGIIIEKKVMNMKVLKKQTNSKMCIICGMDNHAGVHAPFYEMENGSVISLFSFQDVHQSYPERTHGGLISTMLDEIIGRAIWVLEPDVWGVTMDINVKFRKPVPYEAPIKAYGKIIKNSKRGFTGVGYILDQDDNILAEGVANYFKMPLEKISNEAYHDDVNLLYPDDIKEIKIDLEKIPCESR